MLNTAADKVLAKAGGLGEEMFSYATDQVEKYKQQYLQGVGTRGPEGDKMKRLRGEEQSRGLEYQKTGTLLGMSQQRLAAANEARRQAKAQQMSAVGDIANLGAQVASAGINKMPGGGTPQTFGQGDMQMMTPPGGTVPVMTPTDSGGNPAPSLNLSGGGSGQYLDYSGGNFH